MKRCLVLACGLCLLPAGPALAQPSRADYIAQADPICAAAIQGENNAVRGAKPLKKLANQLLSVDARTKAMVADYGFQACNGF